MKNTELLQKASACSMDDLVRWINDYKSKARLLEEIKRVRIADGEKTTEMKKREAKKQKAVVSAQ